MGSLKAWLIVPHEQGSDPFIQLKFPMIDLNTHDVSPLFMHPTELEPMNLRNIEKRFDVNDLNGSLVFLKDYPDADLFWG